MLGLLLSKRNINITTAEDGEIAVSIVKQHGSKFDFIFMDNMMPNINGIEATRAIRELGYDKVILGLTGNTLDEELVEFEQAGADHVLKKPLIIQHLDIILDHITNFGTETTCHLRNGPDESLSLSHKITKSI